MLPQLKICMLVVFVFVGKAERRAVLVHRHYRAAGKVYAYAAYIALVNARAAQRLGDYVFEHKRKIVGILQRPIGRQRLPCFRKNGVDNAVRVVHNGISHFFTIAGTHNECARGKSAEVNADRVFLIHRNVSPCVLCSGMKHSI